MRVVQDQPRAAFTSGCTPDARRQPIARLGILKPTLGVLVSGELKEVAPTLLVPWALDQAPGLQVVPNGQRPGVRRTEVLLLRVEDPLPSRPHHRDDGRLAVTGWNVNEEPPEFPTGDSLEVLTDLLDVPGLYELGSRLNHMPGLFDELVEGGLSPPPRLLPADQFQQYCRS